MNSAAGWKGSSMRFVIKSGNTLFGPMWSTLAGALAVAVCTCVMLVLSTDARAQVTTKDVVLMGYGSGKCVRVADGSLAAGAAVLQWTCDESAGSRWMLQARGSSPHVLVVAKDSGKCLSVAGGSTADEAAIVQNDCTGADSQLWAVSAFGNFYRLVAKHSGKCLNVPGDTDAAGTPLIQWTCGGGVNETWSFSEGFLDPTDVVRVANASSNLCADIQFGLVTENAAVIQWHCTPGASNELWSLRRASDGYQLVVQISGKCLAPVGGSTASGANMVQVTCGTALSQVWSLSATGSNYALVNKSSSLCLDVGGDQVSPDALLVQRPCTAAPSQGWRLSNAWAKGSWSPRVGLPIVPVAAAVLKNNKVLFWSSYDASTWTGGGPAQTQTVVYDLATKSATQVQVSETAHDMFCPGTAMLADGRVHVSGGQTSPRTSIYDPTQGTLGTWTAGKNMNVARGYNGAALTSTGKVFTVGGSWSGNAGQDKKGELWSPATNSWTALNGIPSSTIVGPDPYGIFAGDNHAWLFSVEGGKLFHAGPSAQMNWFSTNGSGSYTSAGYRGTAGYTMNGNAVMYDVRRILTLGGAPAYVYAAPTARAYTIDITSGVKVRQTGSMSYARTYSNGVALPDGSVFVAGGQAYARPFTDTTPVLHGEIWQPSTGTFSLLASEAIPRTYHSLAVLVPDGRVLVGGGGLCGVGCDSNHYDFEFYSPPYMFGPDGRDAFRPAITAAPDAATYNTQVSVTTSTAVTSFVLVRMGAATHAINNDQRRVPLSIASQSGTSYVVRTPTSSGIATPGYYMLFALDAAGVPSVAKIIRVG